MGSARKHNWIAYREAYAAGEMTLSGFAADHKVAESQLRARAKADGWEQARAEFRLRKAEAQTDAVIKVAAKRAAKEFGSSREVRLEAHKIARHIISRVGDGFGVDKETGKPKPTPKGSELLAQTTALEKAFKLSMVTGRHAIIAQRIEVTGAGGGPLQTKAIPTGLEGFSDADIERILRVVESGEAGGSADAGAIADGMDAAGA